MKKSDLKVFIVEADLSQLETMEKRVAEQLVREQQTGCDYIEETKESLFMLKRAVRSYKKFNLKQ